MLVDQNRARACHVLSSTLGWVSKNCLDIKFSNSFRLCDLKSLSKRRGSSEYDSLNKESSKTNKAKKKKELGLGDISSNTDSKESDQEEKSSDEDNKFQGFKVKHQI